jgi:hypothetical protein
MPRAALDPVPEPEPMDIPKMAAEPERAAEDDEQPEDEDEYEEMITLIASDFVAFQDILEDMRFQIADMQMTAGQDRLETQEMLETFCTTSLVTSS